MYNDSGWLDGPGQLGYGDGDEWTVVEYGGNPNLKYATTYFRTSFEVTDPSRFEDATLRLLYDDAGIVYLNGQEIYRTATMGPDPINFNTYAAATVAVDNTIDEVPIDHTLLVNGTNTLAVEIHQASPTSSDVSFDLELEGVLPILTADTLIATGSTWRYLDDGSNQLTAWYDDPMYDDSVLPWEGGPAQLGYGDNPPDEATTIYYGPDPNNKYVTTYFRQAFEVTGDPSEYTTLNVQLLADDGAVLYLNGTEVARDNMPGGAIDYLTLASSIQLNDIENDYVSHPIDPALLVGGTNYLAVEVHQFTVDSADLGFDLELVASRASGPLNGIPLVSGINRIPIETYDGPDGTGNLLVETFFDVYYEVGVGTAVPAGTLAGNEVWIAANGPYRVTGQLVVPVGVTLQIDPGTNVFFESGARILINGKLLALGTADELIHFTRNPNSGTVSWGGLQFANTWEDNLINYAALGYGRTNDGMVGVVDSNLVIDNSHFANTDLRRVRLIDAALTVQNSTFAELYVEPVTSVLNNVSEHIWGRMGLGATGRFLAQNNYFGQNLGHNDMVDVDGGTQAIGDNRMLILNNIFDGTGDDALDLEGDAYIEGNTFMHVRKDVWNTDPGNANAISAGAGHDYVMVRNKFFDVDHAAQVKENATMHFFNNTVVDVAVSAMYFVSPEGSVYGYAAYLDGNVFQNVPVYFEPPGTTILEINRSTIPEEFHVYGVDNVAEEGRVADAANGDFSLVAGFGGGPNGQDMGAMIPPGVTIHGEPDLVTTATGATLTFGGPNYTHFKWRIDGGLWSAELTIDTSAVLSGLADGPHTVEAVGKNLANVWQDEGEASAESWTVDTALAGSVVINEVLAINRTVHDLGGTFPDTIELHNSGTTPVDLSGMGLSDEYVHYNEDIALPHIPPKYIFPGGTILSGGEYLLVYADSLISQAGEIHLGFGLDGDSGEGVFLTTYNGGTFDWDIHDSVEFGMQVPDMSIGRTGRDGQTWALTEPTLGSSANVAARTGDPRALSINEWLAAEKVLFDNDFLELYNPDPLPVPLDGLYLTDNPVADRQLPQAQDPSLPPLYKHQIAPLSFVPGSGAVSFIADDDAWQGKNHLAFKLSVTHEVLAMYDAEGNLIDKIPYYAQTTDVSQGRSPNGSETLAFFDLPTPALPSPIAETTTVASIGITDDITDEWSYLQTTANIGSTWKDPIFSVAAWPTDPALFFVEGAALPAPKRTPLTLGYRTYYFRKDFVVTGDPGDIDSFVMNTVIDDGAVFYINGQEVYRLGMTAGAFNYLTFANRTVIDATYEGPFVLPTGVLVEGDNVIAVEVHQASAGSSDIVFGLTLDATVTAVDDTEIVEAMKVLEGLRITEMMYHPAGNAEAEFIELQNISGSTLDLSGVRFTNGVDFVFPESTSLAPGEFIVVVRNQAVFESIYDWGVPIAGQYTGALNNGGEDITLKLASPLDAALLRFDYNDTWYPSTDGLGYSLNIIDPDAEAATWTKHESWTDAPPTPGFARSSSGVIGRHVFYNNSAYDNESKGYSDDDAIATDKAALLPGETASFLNYTSYSRGINGIMVDIPNVSNPAGIAADDFSFATGNDNVPGGWTPLVITPTVTLRENEGLGGSDRIVLTFADNAIRNEWLQVTVLMGDTGLAAEDVFYLGNAAGETGNSAANARVDAVDVLDTRSNPHPFWYPADIANEYDFNRDRRVNSIDTLIARNNQTWAMTELELIDLSGAKKSAKSESALAATSDVVPQTGKARLHDAALKQTIEAEEESLEAIWLYQFEESATKDQAAKKDRNVALAVDKLLEL